MTSRPHGIDGWGFPNQEYAPEPLVMTEAPRSALVVTPHPDDAEGGCGATMAKWVAESGTKVVILMCTNGNKGTGDRSLTPESLARHPGNRAATRSHGPGSVGGGVPSLRRRRA